MLTYKTKLDLV